MGISEFCALTKMCCERDDVPGVKLRGHKEGTEKLKTKGKGAGTAPELSEWWAHPWANASRYPQMCICLPQSCCEELWRRHHKWSGKPERSERDNQEPPRQGMGPAPEAHGGGSGEGRTCYRSRHHQKYHCLDRRHLPLQMSE